MIAMKFTFTDPWKQETWHGLPKRQKGEERMAQGLPLLGFFFKKKWQGRTSVLSEFMIGTSDIPITEVALG
jgi:hypothetical protein